MKLDAVKLGIAGGLVWTLGLLCIAIAPQFGLWQEIYEFLSRVYIGFNNTSLTGYFIGILWSFADAFIGGFLIAYIYNKLL